MGRMARKSTAVVSGLAIAVALSLASGVPVAVAQESNATASSAQADAVAGIPEWGIASPDLSSDPDVLFGVLPNGMRYALQRNGNPAGDAAIRFNAMYRAVEPTITAEAASEAFRAAWQGGPSRQTATVMRAIAAEMATDPIDSDLLERARNPIRADYERAETQNASWLDLVAMAQSKPDLLDRRRTRLDILNAVGPADIRDAARKYPVESEPVQIRVVPKAAGSD